MGIRDGKKRRWPRTDVSAVNEARGGAPLRRERADNDTLNGRAAHEQAHSQQEAARSRGGSMTTQGESAVLVLAAGAGTRMHSDTPKVLHTIAGRSMLSHSLHAITKVAPQHLVVVLGENHERIEPALRELAVALGRSIDTAMQHQQL